MFANTMGLRRIALAGAAALFASTAAGGSLAAQRDHPTHFDVSHVAAVHDAHGASMGHVAVAVSCGQAAAERVRMGFALLHNMTYTEAGRAFEDAERLEPTCAIAKWGIAMSWVHPLWPDTPTPEQLERGWHLLEDARSLGTAGSREAAYIDALEAYYADGVRRTEPERLASSAEAWKRVAAAHPTDPEAALFTALATIAVTAGSAERAAERMAAGRVAEEVLKAIPDHPGAHHYAIHAFDVPAAAERALGTARSYGAVAPANSHALHMTSHIFTRRGLWEESIDYNRRAADAAWAEPINGQISHHHLHAIDYLAYAYLQRGDDAEADGVLRHLQSLDGPVVNHTVSAYALAAVPARIALERHDWSRASAVQARQPTIVPWDSYPQLEAISVFARGMGAARTGDLAQAQHSARRLAELAEASSKLPDAYDWSTQVRIQEIAVRAWIAYAEGSMASAAALMMEAADLEATTDKNPTTPGEVLPAGELLGDMMMELGRYSDALTAYEVAMERTPNRFNSVEGAARAAAAMGDVETAARHYRALVALAGHSPSRKASIEAAGAYLEAH